MSKNNFRNLYEFVNSLKEFFNQREFKEILSPPAVTHPGIEAHLHPFELHSVLNKNSKNLYLNSSPEFWMKKMLSEDLGDDYKNLYTFAFSFRDEPNSEWHRPQFLMLEWYRKNETYEKIIEDIKNLYEFLSPNQKTETIELTMEETFKRFSKISLDEFENLDSVKTSIKKYYPELNQIDELKTWDDAFHYFFLNIIEPQFKPIDSLIIKEYPARLSALSEISKSNPKVCYRFEWFVKGIETANSFQELTDLSEQTIRAKQELKEKKDLYGYELSEPKELFQALENGLPPCSGIALGVDRLLKVLDPEFEFCFPF
ncbi:MAG: amino acid--tRNA ligase-related protein [Bacteriovoracaceae bacterium]